MKPLEASALGATDLGGGRCHFCVWAPRAQKIEVHLIEPRNRIVELSPQPNGYHCGVIDSVEPGALYVYRLDGDRERPDPASRFQPRGVHGPSQVVSSEFAWEDGGWQGLPLEAYIIYELHVATFTPEGTFDGVIGQLDYLQDLGVTAIELMPVAQFPGTCNWGYDGVYPFAVQDSYGGPKGLKSLVDACHARGLAVILDVVYNHLGPEGNYLQEFGPYFTDRYRTPWGSAINFDGPGSDEVRRFFIENALYWITEFHIDGLRLDAVHAIFDQSAYPFLRELAETVHREALQRNRRVYLIAESNLNDRRLIQVPERGGLGLDAQWNDDFHHALHTLLTEDRTGYYEDFGQLEHLVKAFAEGFVYSGQFSVYRGRRHGSSSRELDATKFVVCAQNHDQVGNRMLGERLSMLVPLEALKLAVGTVLLSPFIPLLFMGEEYGESAPFLYFVSHSDPSLIEAVRRGRREEFTAFRWQAEPPDPQDQATFDRCCLDHSCSRAGQHRVLLDFYKELIRLRKTLPALSSLSKEQMEVVGFIQERVLFIRRWNEGEEIVGVFHFGKESATVTLPVPQDWWRKQLDSSDARWQGAGSALPDKLFSEGEAALTLGPLSFSLYAKELES